MISYTREYLEDTGAICSFRGKYSFLSNFYKINIPYHGITYPSVEHAYQASKSKSKNARLLVADSTNPKSLGRKLVQREDFDLLKCHTMYKLLKIKFENTKLKELLLATEDSLLVEGNTWKDRFWGCEFNFYNYTYIGHNILGFQLMYLRNQL